MSTFVTELFWAEEKQSEPPLPGTPHDFKGDKEERQPKAAPVATPENYAERLQQVAGNAALARQAEEAEAARKQLADAAQRPMQAPVAVAPPVVAAPAQQRREKAREPEDRKAAPTAEKKKLAQKRLAEKVAATAAKRLPDSVKAAARRAGALAAVLADFERAPGDADLLGLALLVEDAPPEIAEGTARALAKAAMRADPDQRLTIAARVKDQLGGRRDLRLSRLLADRLAWSGPAPRAAPPPPQPPPAPPG